MWVQSFELTNLLDLKAKHGYQANTTFLTTAGGAVRPGRPRRRAHIRRPAHARELAHPEREHRRDRPGEGSGDPPTEDGTLGSPTSLVDDAHAAGLKVIPWTFRNENTFLPADYRVGTEEGRYGRAIDEIVVFLKTGIDGFFTDQPDTGVVARAVFQSRR